ncbi:MULTISPECIES: formate dehydrogenase accessory sulfurtransferase FdhD [unclassified Methanoculleus]|uniref:formate dehydrogenase accessory sulfurtransferase FdhD n=1 Tax=unclassified Methanoculleus TaxID=2619537 RepID=UPI0025F88157|nr:MULTISPECIES: formate dehydrogenase accessory sulfurtransferase FdhD [unclassified Methanoculleus]MCK9319280.1 formate dehydrogenase accessory sulfurtransferase FdhD [Methanoculleus sp.]MDD2254757.1 formate dehydrogenase accessory sulfurtransferase FdhD [Methanoculleus sp.]MDD2788476.1 formate dehydrogenase accessory sulfurtransferase FdhD [Methanoculleus sp.]MDD3217345.1 formate dehydrogenase accessory sulfurtransferase FdhD [Methanoculleus sp.]MDD4315160.1 formate dehydrogenase accessory 
MFKKIACIRIGGGKIALDAAEEAPVAIFVNGRHLTTVILSPTGLQDFVTGYLYTEEIIRSADEIESVRVEENRISVLTTNIFKRVSVKKTILSGCGGAVSYIDTQKLPAIHSDRTVSIPELEKAVTALPAPGMIEVIALIDGGHIAARSEDIDRHNALDRVIGRGLRDGLDFSRTVAVGTGTVTSEMVRKCLVANIPVLVSTGPPTALAVEVAEETGLAIVGSAGTPEMAVYTHPERIEGCDGP